MTRCVELKLQGSERDRACLVEDSVCCVLDGHVDELARMRHKCIAPYACRYAKFNNVYEIRYL